MENDNKPNQNELDELTKMLSAEQSNQPTTEQINRISRIYTSLVFFMGIFVAVLLGVIVSGKCGWMFGGFWSLAMYLNITITTLSNVFLGRDIDGARDAGWKSVFGFITAVCLAIAFSI